MIFLSASLTFRKGLVDGLPIGLGYLAVSFAFGMMAADNGLSVLQSVLISAVNMTSAGQFAGLTVITTGAPYIEMVLTQLVINMRYAVYPIAFLSVIAGLAAFIALMCVAGKRPGSEDPGLSSCSGNEDTLAAFSLLHQLRSRQ